MNADNIFLAIISLAVISIFLFQVYKIHKLKFTHQYLPVRYVSIVIGIFFAIATIIISENIYHYLIGLSTALNFFASSFSLGISESGFVYKSNRGGFAGLVPIELKYEKSNKVNMERRANKVVVIFYPWSAEKKLEFAEDQYEDIRRFLEAKSIKVND